MSDVSENIPDVIDNGDKDTNSVSDILNDDSEQCEDYSVCEMINRMLRRRSRYFVTLNALTRIFLLFGRGRVTWNECRQKAEMLIFKCEQTDRKDEHTDK